jgi:hypothetical protein
MEVNHEEDWKAGMMSVRCSWCKRDMGQKMGPEGLVTDGICDACLKRGLSHSTKRWCSQCGERLPYDNPINLCNGCEADANDTDMHPQSEAE